MTANASGAKRLENYEILVVEDAADNQLLFSSVLSRAGAHVDTADDGADGIKKALNRHYDVVLMDIQMPKLNGLEATRELRVKGYRKPIIALTALAMVNDREICLQAGCNDYISKPIDITSLVDKVASHLPLRL